MAGIDEELCGYLDQTFDVLQDAFVELEAIHRYYYPNCNGGCPTHHILTRLKEQTIRTQALRTALGYADPR